MKFQISNFKFQIDKGFTLVEVLVAVAIMVLIIGAAVSIETQYIRITSFDKHRLQAVNLAQEALNLTRTIRDTNLLVPQDAFTGIIANTGTGGNADGYCVVPDGSDKWKLVNYDPNDINSPCIKTLDGTAYTVKVDIVDQ